MSGDSSLAKQATMVTERRQDENSNQADIRLVSTSVLMYKDGQESTRES
jgi:hypothetical protein